METILTRGPNTRFLSEGFDDHERHRRITVAKEAYRNCTPVFYADDYDDEATWHPSAPQNRTSHVVLLLSLFVERSWWELMSVLLVL